jgi:hypothetical protein
MTPAEIEALHEEKRLEFWRSRDTACNGLDRPERLGDSTR